MMKSITALKAKGHRESKPSAYDWINYRKKLKVSKKFQQRGSWYLYAIDAIGFLADFMVISKIIMQQVWKCEIEWNPQLPENIYCQWRSYMELLPMVKETKIPRSYGENYLKMRDDLHIFADASESVMASVGYWRLVSEHSIRIVFICGKSACAPTRYHTILKLQLKAAVLAVSLENNICHYHNVLVKRVCFCH